MSASLLDDAMAHHIWATEQLIDACGELTAEQLARPAPGTYGSVLDTLRHLLASDSWYLTFFRDEPPAIDGGTEASLDDLRAKIAANGRAWLEVLAGGPDADTDVVEHGDGWNYHAPLGLRLAQVIHHGTDHRSQVCTALTSFGLTPPEIDLWNWGEAVGRVRPEYL